MNLCVAPGPSGNYILFHIVYVMENILSRGCKRPVAHGNGWRITTGVYNHRSATLARHAVNPPFFAMHKDGGPPPKRIQDPRWSFAPPESTVSPSVEQRFLFWSASQRRGITPCNAESCVRRNATPRHDAPSTRGSATTTCILCGHAINNPRHRFRDLVSALAGAVFGDILARLRLSHSPDGEAKWVSPVRRSGCLSGSN